MNYEILNRCDLKPVGGWMGGWSKSCFKDYLQQSKIIRTTGFRIIVSFFALFQMKARVIDRSEDQAKDFNLPEQDFDINFSEVDKDNQDELDSRDKNLSLHSLVQDELPKHFNSKT